VADPRVLVLVLNYNGGDALDPCLRSLRATTYPKAQIVVLDNGSTDGSLEIARRHGLEIHEFGANLGSCAAYNRAFELFSDRAEFILLSNADVIVPPPTIQRMVATALSDETIGFVAPIQRHADTREIRSTGIRWRCGRMPVHATEPGEPYDAVEGAFVLIRPAVNDRVGGLDESLFLNLEDVEWQLRAKDAGFRIRVTLDAEILHRRPGTERRHTGAYYQTRNACVLTSRRCSSGDLVRLRRRLFVEGLAGRILARPRAPYILAGLRDFRNGVTGMRRFERGTGRVA
jgi:N-acetylglucosaminyl-diphospho-decaprenol L-rhamnosyltransferase